MATISSGALGNLVELRHYGPSTGGSSGLVVAGSMADLNKAPESNPGSNRFLVALDEPSLAQAVRHELMFAVDGASVDDTVAARVYAWQKLQGANEYVATQLFDATLTVGAATGLLGNSVSDTARWVDSMTISNDHAIGGAVVYGNADNSKAIVLFDGGTAHGIEVQVAQANVHLLWRVV